MRLPSTKPHLDVSPHGTFLGRAVTSASVSLELPNITGSHGTTCEKTVRALHSHSLCLSTWKQRHKMPVTSRRIHNGGK